MNQDRRQKSISDVLKHPKNELAELIHKVNVLKDLNQTLRALLDPKLAKHCEIANFENNTLVLTVDNANWATRIRYAIPDLIKQLKQHPSFNKLKSIKCIITPEDL